MLESFKFHPKIVILFLKNNKFYANFNDQITIIFLYTAYIEWNKQG